MTRRILAIGAYVGLCALAMIPAGQVAATDGGAGSSAPTTLMGGWEQKYTLDWEATRARDGAPRIQGYVVSHHGGRAEPFRLLVQSLDGSGRVVDRRLAWVHGGVGGFDHVPFEVCGLPVADHYQVTVWDYSIRRR